MESALPDKAIGWKADLTEEELSGKVIDGLTTAVFNNEEDYLDHVSPVTGYTPRDPEHYGNGFLNVQKKALERGAARKVNE